MDKSLETESSKSYQEESENLNRLTENKEIEAANKKLPGHKSTGPYGFTGEFYKTLREVTRIFSNYSKKFKKTEDSKTLFIRPVLS